MHNFDQTTSIELDCGLRGHELTNGEGDAQIGVYHRDFPLAIREDGGFPAEINYRGETYTLLHEDVLHQRQVYTKVVLHPTTVSDPSNIGSDLTPEETAFYDQQYPED